jgi:hypothetical protein
MAILMFWSAFLFRTAISVVLNTTNPSVLFLPIRQIVRQLLISVTAGSLIIAAMIYAAYRADWFGNFPRSVFVIDWLMIFGLSLLTRFIFRGFHVYKIEPLPA